eukprot:1139866-Pelagomonas_calceolata.AAC.7
MDKKLALVLINLPGLGQQVSGTWLAVGLGCGKLEHEKLLDWVPKHHNCGKHGRAQGRLCCSLWRADCGPPKPGDQACAQRVPLFVLQPRWQTKHTGL